MTTGIVSRYDTLPLAGIWYNSIASILFPGGEAMLSPVSDITICRNLEYNTFPSLARRPDGQLIAAFRNAPDRRDLLAELEGCQRDDARDLSTHIDHASRVVCVRSGPGGRTWTRHMRPVCSDFVYGCQDANLICLADGTLMCVTFRWKVLDRNDFPAMRPNDRMLYDRWIGRPGGVVTVRSIDGGLTWDTPIPLTADGILPMACRGRAVQLADGTLLQPTYGLTEGEPISTCRLFTSRDAGRSWTYLSRIIGPDDYHLHEPCLYAAPSGRLFAFIRTRHVRNKWRGDPTANPLVTCCSDDGGSTWSEAALHPEVDTPSPFDILSLPSGQALVSYGHRRLPYSIRAFLLDGECRGLERTLPEPVEIHGGALGTDIGYTSAVVLSGNEVLIAYYIYGQDGYRHIMGTLCHIQ